MKKNKIVIHDFCAHPFTFELAEEFNNQSENIHYLFTNDDIGPKADFSKTTCTFTSISVGYKIPKSNPFKRLIWEIRYAFLLKKKLAHLKPDHLICSNTPVIILLIILFRKKFKFIWWVQDIFSEAAIKLEIIPKYIRYLAFKFLQLIEFIIAIKSSSIILISEDFKVFFNNRFQTKINVIENWPSAKYSELISRNKNKTIIYAGTIGFKHGKDRISKTIKYALTNNFKFTLISEGKNADELKKLFSKDKNFKGYNFLPYPELIKKISMSCGALFVLDDSASKLSIPSKAYTYFLCKTPVLGFCDPNHHLAKIINSNGLGIINDLNSFFDGIRNNEAYSKWLVNIKSYSNNFNIDNKYKEFKNVLNKIN